jgi:hypothetical protein
LGDFLIYSATLTIISNQEKIMATLDDLNKGIADIQAAVAAAITLIQSLHTGAGTVSDAEVEAAVTKLEAASAALGGAQPQP